MDTLRTRNDPSSRHIYLAAVAMAGCLIAALFLGALSSADAWADDATTGDAATTDASTTADASSSDVSDTATADQSGSADATTSDEQDPFPGVGNVYLVNIPNLTWDDIDNETTPTIQYIAGNYTVANVIEGEKVDIYHYEQCDRFHYVSIDSTSLEDADDYVERIFNNLTEHDSLIITSSPSLSTNTYDVTGYSVLIMVDGGDNGLLESNTVRRAGLLTSANVGDIIDDLLVDRQTHPANVYTSFVSWSMGAQARTSTLSRENSIVISIAESTDFYIMLLVISASIALAASLVLLFLDARRQPAFLEHFLPAVRILWILVMSIPLAAYLMLPQLPVGTTSEITIDYLFFTIMEISFVCFIIALVLRWTYAFIFMLGLTVFVILIDPIIGGPMTFTSLLSYDPIQNVRYYGIGNEGAALAFGAWIMLSAFILNRANPERRATQRFKKWGFAVGSLVVIFITAAPWLGANFGVIIWGLVTAIFAWAMFNGIKPTWKQVFVLVILAGAAAYGVLWLDSTFNMESHMGTTADTLHESWYTAVFTLAIDMLRLSWNTLTYSPLLSVAFFAVCGFLVWIRKAKPGPYRKFWEDNQPFAAGYAANLVCALLMLLVEDSGIVMPALVLLYDVTGLLWMVCNFHSWHIRNWTAHKARITAE
jgi:hypothetical protein